MNILRKLRTKDGLIIFLFLVVEFCLWIPILIFSVEPFYTPYKYTSCCLKMAVVVLFPIVAFLLKKNEIFIGALLATVGADTFLSYISKVLDTPYEAEIPGLAFFLLVQIIFAIYFYVTSQNKKQQLYITIARIVFMVIFGCLAMLMPRQEPQVYIMAVYIPNIVLNIVCAGFKKNYFMMVAFIVYAISDLFVGLGNIGVKIPFTFSWLLYVPANVMLVMSEDTCSYFFNCKKEK